MQTDIFKSSLSEVIGTDDIEDKLIKMADERLYQAKQEGRNKIVTGY